MMKGNETFEFAGTKIEISSIEESNLDENGTGYLHLIQFTERTGQEVRNALTDYGGMG